MTQPSGDEELKSRTEDGLNRKPLAEAIAKQIASADAEQAIVFGISGPWGSGKTSLLNMTSEALTQDYGGALMLGFNPWLFSGAEHLTGIFFAELGGQLNDLSGKPWQELGAAMQSYGEGLAKLRAAPGFGRWAESAGRAFKFGGRWFLGAADEGASLLERKNRLRDALAGVDRKLVIVVDDLDRLRRQEIRDVVALVRLNADLPNVLFVLAYDRKRVEKALEETEGDGPSYLEKIVQVVHDVPEAREIDLKGALVDSVTEITNSVSTMGPYDPNRVGEVLKELVFPLVQTPRDIKRYANVLPVTIDTVGDEVALADVLGLEALRLFMPEIYSMLSERAGALTTPTDTYVTDHKERDRELVEELRHAANGQRYVVENACALLFPAGYSLVRNNHYSSEQDDEAATERRVASWRVLRFFLDKQLPQAVLPAREVQAVFDALGREDTLSALLEDVDLHRLDRLLLRLQEYENQFDPTSIMTSIPVISNRHARLMGEAGRGNDLGTDISYGGLMRMMLGKIGDQQALALQLKQILPRIRSVSVELELIDIVGYRPNTGEGLVSEEDAAWFEEHLLTVLDNTEPESLAKEYAINQLLFRARQIDEERGTEFINRFAESDDVFLTTLRGFYQRSTIALLGSDVEGDINQRQPKLHWNQACSLLGEDTIKRRIRELKNKFQPRDLGEPTAEVLQLADSYASGNPPAWDRSQ